MPLNLSELIKKAKDKGIEPLFSDDNKEKSSQILRPWQQESVLFLNKDKKNRQQTENKLATNGQRNRNKPTTNQQQTNNIIKEFDNKSETQLATHLATNRQQTSNKPTTKIPFSSLVGLQRILIIFIYSECKIARSKITENLTLEYISKSINSSSGCVKTTLQRLEAKNFIDRVEYKSGRGGWSKYSLPDKLFQELLQLETDNKLATNRQQTGNKLTTQPTTQPTTSVSSSGSVLNILKETTTGDGNKNIFNQDIPEEWQLDIEPLQQIGFTQTHLKQIASQNKLSPQLVQDSIYGFAFDIENNDKLKKINKDPISYFMGIVRTGQVYTFSSNYESPQDKAMRLHLERTRELERQRTAMEKEALDHAFRAWFSELSDAQKRELLPEKMRGGAKLEKNIFLESSARSKFETEIWPAKRKEITGYEATSKEEVEEQNQTKNN